MIKSQKKLHRFFLPAIPSEKDFEISDEKLTHQLASVLRYSVGERLIVFSENTDDQVVMIKNISKKSVLISTEGLIPARMLPKRNIIAAVSIIKKDLFELIVQKLTELGVRTIVPIVSSRTIKQSIRKDRLDQISLEAVEQSGSNRLVEIHSPISLEECLEKYKFPSVVFSPTASLDILNIDEKETVVMYVGPEGGWSEEDREIFGKYSLVFATLGYTVLRTETAAIVGAYELLKQ